MHIDADSGAVGDALAELRAGVQGAGGGFRADMTTVARGDALWVTADGAETGDERLMAVPAACLPALAPDWLALEAESFVLAAAPPAEPAAARSARDALLTVYNACAKAAAWRTTTPWLTLARDPALLDVLAGLRGGNPKAQGYRDLARRGAWDRLLVESFLGARLFRLRPPGADADPAESTAAAGEPVLMPFVDFLNHDFRARAYEVSTDGDGVRRLWSHTDRPTADGRECRVLYTLLDPLDSLLFYGFVDDSAPVMRSVPVELELREGIRITVNAGASTAFRGTLPAALEDIRLFVPPAQARAGDHLTLPWLLLPGPGSPWALRRVLRALVYALRPHLTETARRATVAEAEDQILRANRAALDTADDQVGAARARPPADPPAGRTAGLDALAAAVGKVRARLDAYEGRLARSPAG